jgi:glycosyltransferase involved in cell wall biosynthesis
MRMIIGIDIRNIGKKRTGDEVVFFNLTKNFARLDDKNNYKLFTDINDEKIIGRIKNNLEINNKANFEIISLKTKNKFSWNFWTLQKYLRKNPVDIYLTQYITPWFVPKKIKIATIIHDISFNFYPQLIKKADLFFLKTLIPLSLKRADKILAVSQFTKDEIIKFYKVSPEKVEVTYNAVSEDFLRQDGSEEKIKHVKEKYHLPEKFILYIGTLQPRKNIIALVKAFAALENKNLKLVIAGGKGHNYDKNIDNAVFKNNLAGRIIFPGFIKEEDKLALMKAAEIFCFPSFYEGFGIPILEAMAAGVPTVVSDIPCHREIAKEASDYFNPFIPGDLALKLEELLDNKILRENFLASGQRRFMEFSWEKTAGKVLEIFEKLNK